MYITKKEMTGEFPTVKKVLLGGDTHHNFYHMAYLYMEAVKWDCDVIFILGDFGYWEANVAGRRFIEAIEEGFQDTGIPVVFLDGNHEDHELLRWRYMAIPPDPTVTQRTLEDMMMIDKEVSTETGMIIERYTHPEHGFVRIRDGLWYAPRGCTWTWNGVSFLAAGGAFSVDRKVRKYLSSWFPEEVITDEDIATCAKAGQVDVVLSHDVPWSVPIETHLAMQGRHLGFSKESNENRLKLWEIVSAAQPKWVFHGHMHVRYRSYLQLGKGKMVDVIGLNCDGTDAESWIPIKLDPEFSKDGRI